MVEGQQHTTPGLRWPFQSRLAAKWSGISDIVEIIRVSLSAIQDGLGPFGFKPCLYPNDALAFVAAIS